MRFHWIGGSRRSSSRQSSGKPLVRGRNPPRSECSHSEKGAFLPPAPSTRFLHVRCRSQACHRLQSIVVCVDKLSRSVASGGTGDGDGGLTAHSTKARESRSIDTGKVFIIFFVSILIGFTSQQCLLLRLTAPAGECSPYGTNNQGELRYTPDDP